MSDAASRDEGIDESARRRTWMRLGTLAVVLVVSAIALERAGVAEQLSLEQIRTTIDSLGPLGALAFIGLFVVGEIVHVPGFVFVAAAILAYGRVLGGLLGYSGAVFAMGVVFVIVRAIGGSALGTIRRPFVQRMLARVDERPLLAVTALRSVLWMTPALTYALALTRVRFRDYIAGTALGLVLPIAGMSVFFDWLLAYLGR